MQTPSLGGIEWLNSEPLDPALSRGYALVMNFATTRPPSKALATDTSQVVHLATLQELSRHWSTERNWRKVGAKLNALPQFTTEIDGGDVPFVALTEGDHAFQPAA